MPSNSSTFVAFAAKASFRILSTFRPFCILLRPLLFFFSFFFFASVSFGRFTVFSNPRLKFNSPLFFCSFCFHPAELAALSFSLAFTCNSGEHTWRSMYPNFSGFELRPLYQKPYTRTNQPATLLDDDDDDDDNYPHTHSFNQEWVLVRIFAALGLHDTSAVLRFFRRFSITYSFLTTSWSSSLSSDSLTITQPIFSCRCCHYSSLVQRRCRSQPTYLTGCADSIRVQLLTNRFIVSTCIFHFFFRHQPRCFTLKTIDQLNHIISWCRNKQIHSWHRFFFFLAILDLELILFASFTVNFFLLAFASISFHLILVSVCSSSLPFKSLSFFDISGCCIAWHALAMSSALSFVVCHAFTDCRQSFRSFISPKLFKAAATWSSRPFVLFTSRSIHEWRPIFSSCTAFGKRCSTL